MEQGTTLIAILHIAVALFLIVVVLLQDSKGGGVGGSFGGGSSQTIFGASGAASFMVKLTRVCAVVFMLTCIGLTLMLSRNSGRSVVDSMPVAPSGSAPVAPAVPAAPLAVPAQPAPAAPSGK
ncbi:MAG: preprotein translocase subunit SecG [Oligoflexia bacterium]|nr:preprotein translocase subunit SecG [Oligoflexia bacterium]